MISYIIYVASALTTMIIVISLYLYQTRPFGKHPDLRRKYIRAHRQWHEAQHLLYTAKDVDTVIVAREISDDAAREITALFKKADERQLCKVLHG